MVNGIPYDSAKGRAWAASKLSAPPPDMVYQVSAKLAEKRDRSMDTQNAESMMKVIGLHAENLMKSTFTLHPKIF